VDKHESWPTCSGGSYGDTRADELEGYESLIERTNTWLRDESDVSVVNIQSILVQKDNTAGESDSVPVTLLACGQTGVRRGDAKRGTSTSVFGHFGPFMRTELTDDRSD